MSAIVTGRKKPSILKVFCCKGNFQKSAFCDFFAGKGIIGFSEGTKR